MKCFPLVVAVALVLFVHPGRGWSSEHAPANPAPPPEPPAVPKEPKKTEAPKREAPAETPAPPPKPAKESKEGAKEGKEPKESKETKNEAPPIAPKAKTDATKEGHKKDAAGADKSAESDPEPQPAQPKAETHPKRTLGSAILTIKLAMMADAALFPYDIEVALDGEKAVLSGKVATEEEKHRAAELVQGLELVKGVVNKLELSKDLIAAHERRHDQAIVQYVKERFARSETLKAAGFEVKCEQGVVSLSGKTRFQVFALEAAQAARQVPGVRAVDTSNIQLSGEGKE